ncbi:MAG: helix-turn-helix domain-containing protein, partial [Thermoleophilaceae bacterium]
MRSDARRNRASMVAAARRDLSERGSLSMRRVAMTAGVSRSTLYRHFSTRAALEDALREEALGAARVAIEREVQEDRPPVAVLRRLVEARAGPAPPRPGAAQVRGAGRGPGRPGRGARR